MKAQGAVIVDPFRLPDYEALTKGLWCGDFEADLNTYLKTHAKNAQYHSLSEVVASGLYLPYIQDEIQGALKPPKEADDRRSPCPDVYHDPPKIAFRDALLKAMQTDRLDAIIYPSVRVLPPTKKDVREGKHDEKTFPTNTLIASQTWMPSICMPAGFSEEGLPVGLEFVVLPYHESDLFRLGSSFEAATRNRRAPVFK